MVKLNLLFEIEIVLVLVNEHDRTIMYLPYTLSRLDLTVHGLPLSQSDST